MRVVFLIWSLVLLFGGNTSFAQMGGGEIIPTKDAKTRAWDFINIKEYKNAIPILDSIYNRNTSDLNTYTDYLNVLLLAKEFKKAEQLAKDQQQIRSRDPLPYVDLGRVFNAEGKEKKANEQYDIAIQLMGQDEVTTQQMVAYFNSVNKIDYTIRTLERARSLQGNNYYYTSQLAKLYMKQGDADKALNFVLDFGAIQMSGLEITKSTLLELLGDDQQKMQLTQKALIKRINEQPENIYADILTWLYTQKNDWDGALIQVQAIDDRNKEGGRRIIDFAREAVKEAQYDVAIKAYDAVVAEGKDKPFYALAYSEKLSAELTQLEENTTYKAEDVVNVGKQFQAFLDEFPKYYGSEIARDYAKLEAQYAGDAQKGIDILNHALAQENLRRDLMGKCKLQLGDYQILTGNIWDAALTYGQVEKEFKEGVLGEDAKFRRARLAYYRGDFYWAQIQLSFLKAATYDLIANDAIYLSVLITENIGPDSNLVPLTKFAHADLLLFQNRDKEAELLLDSITAAFPDHPLNDDILMMRSEIAQKHRDYKKALGYLQIIFEKYGKDVLGDDAVFNTAEIYYKYLKDKDKAKDFYEKLIIDYPGSTFVQTARKRLEEIKNGPVPTKPIKTS